MFRGECEHEWNVDDDGSTLQSQTKLSNETMNNFLVVQGNGDINDDEQKKD